MLQREELIMNQNDEKLIENIVADDVMKADALNIRKNGKCLERKINPNIDITTRDDNMGITVRVKPGTLFGTIHIPVIITESGLNDVVYNDFYIGAGSNVIIVAGCGIHNDKDKKTQHDGIHRFYLEDGAKVHYIERHYGEGTGEGKKVLNPVTEIFMGKNSKMTMDTFQIKGVDDTDRVTKAELGESSTLIINEKILTSNKQYAKTKFKVKLKGKDSSTHVTSRSVATDNSYQEFISEIIGKSKCYAHVECDAIIKDTASVKAIPEIFAKSVDANLIHEAAIGKIAGEQLIKLMSLGLTQKEAEDKIIAGFLK